MIHWSPGPRGERAGAEGDPEEEVEPDPGVEAFSRDWEPKPGRETEPDKGTLALRLSVSS